MIDIPRLKADMRRIEEQIREVKTPLRTRWTRDMSSNQVDLIRLRAQATELYTYRAWLRGKLHRKNPPEHVRHLARDIGHLLPHAVAWDAKEHAQQVADRVGKHYQVQAEAS